MLGNWPCRCDEQVDTPCTVTLLVAACAIPRNLSLGKSLCLTLTLRGKRCPEAMTQESLRSLCFQIIQDTGEIHRAFLRRFLDRRSYPPRMPTIGTPLGGQDHLGRSVNEMFALTS